MNKQKLISELQRFRSLTCGWDMVCCYNPDMLNQMLAAEYTSGRLSMEIPIHEEVEALFVGSVIVDGKITLKSPTICFNQDGSCKIEMYVKAGKISETNGEKTYNIELAEDSYRITGTLPLSAVSGSMEKVNNAITAESPDLESFTRHSARTVIEFDGSQGCQMFVYLDFSAIEEDSFHFEEAAIDPSSTDPNLIDYIKPAMKQYLENEVNSFRYILGGISSIPEQYKYSTNLYPRACLFCVQHTKEGSSLNIYMKISDSLDDTGSYSGNIGIDDPQFPNTEWAFCPLPDKSTSAIAISQNLLLEMYIRKECSKLKWNVEIDKNYKEGLKFLLKNPAVTIKTEDVYKTDTGGNVSNTTSRNGININFDDVPLELIFKDQAGKFFWEYSTDISYEDEFTSWGTGSPVVNNESHVGKFTYKISCDKAIELSAVQAEQVKMDFSLEPKDYKLSSEIISAKRKRLDFIIIIPIPTYPDDKEHANTIIQCVDEQVKKVLPSFSFDFGELNLFFAANLLFPGKHTFRIDSKDAFGFPSDMMVFGSIALHES